MRVRGVHGEELTTRPVSAGPVHEAVDLLREGQLALVVCVKCGATWLEAEEPPVCNRNLRGPFAPPSHDAWQDATPAALRNGR